MVIAGVLDLPSSASILWANRAHPRSSASSFLRVFQHF
jgi:hypothetical protein